MRHGRLFLVVMILCFAQGMFSGANGSQAKTVLDALQSGDKAKMDKAIESIEAERAELIDGLVKVLDDLWKVRESQKETVRYALTALGKLKAVEAMDTLIRYLDFSMIPMDVIPISDEVVITPPSEQFPAFGALMEIGPCAIESLLEAVASGRTSPQSEGLVGWIVEMMLGDDGEARIRAYASGLTDEEKKQRVLSEALLGCYTKTATTSPDR